MANKNTDLVECKYLFEKYGITEWHEKRIMLGEEKAAIVINDLNNGVESPLVTLARQPFPLFAEAYVKRLDNFPLKDDPAIGYKLYLLSDEELMLFVSRIKYRKPKNKAKEQEGYSAYIKFTPSFENVNEDLQYPLEEFYKTRPDRSQILCDYKFLYISRYIDLEEAERIGSKYLNLFKHEGSNGYALDEKLALFNPVMRKLIEDKIGYNGGIREEMDLNQTLREKSKKIFEFIIPSFKMSLGTLRNKLGNKAAKPNDESGYIEYSNSAFKELDISITTYFIWIYLLSEQERTLLKWAQLSNTQMYIFNKYYNTSVDKIMDLFLVDRQRAMTSKMDFDEIQHTLDEHKKF